MRHPPSRLLLGFGVLVVSVQWAWCWGCRKWVELLAGRGRQRAWASDCLSCSLGSFLGPPQRHIRAPDDCPGSQGQQRKPSDSELRPPPHPLQARGVRVAPRGGDGQEQHLLPPPHHRSDSRLLAEAVHQSCLGLHRPSGKCEWTGRRHRTRPGPGMPTPLHGLGAVGVQAPSPTGGLRLPPLS